MKRSIIITLALIAAIAVPPCASSVWARGLGVLWLGGGGAAVAAPEINCTGSEAFLRGSNASGDTESFEMGTGDTCASDWTISGSTGVDTYSTGASLFGGHSLSLTDDSTATASMVRADHGSAQTAQYYRFYIKIPTVASGKLYVICGPGKYLTSISSPIYVVNQSGGYRIRHGSTTEYIDVTVGSWYRVELYVHDADGSGPEVGTTTLRAYDSTGVAVETTNGGGDYELSGATLDQFRYFIFLPEYNNDMAATAYIDGVKNCDNWCGAE